MSTWSGEPSYEQLAMDTLAMDYPYRLEGYSATGFGTSAETREKTGHEPLSAKLEADANTLVAEYPEALMAQRKSVTLPLLLLTLPLFTVVVALGLVAPLVFIFGVHSAQSDGGDIVTDAPLAIILTITQIGAAIMTIGVVIGMMIDTYRVAALWIKHSSSASLERPTPLQMGLLMNTLQGASIVAFSKALLNLFRSRRVQTSSLLISATLRLGLLVGLAYSVSIVSTVFHGTATTAVVKYAVPLPISQEALSLNNATDIGGMLFSRQFNQTMCDQAAKDTDTLQPWVTRLCGLMEGTGNVNGDPYIVSRVPGILASNNVSNAHAAAHAEDGTALLVPSSTYTPGNTTFTAQTFGIKMICESITNQCLTDKKGPPTALPLNCTGAAAFNVSIFVNDETDDAATALDAAGNPMGAFNVSTNPFALGVLSNSYSYRDDNANMAGFYTYGNIGAINILHCSVTVLNVTYRYTPPANYTIIESTPSDQLTTQRLATMIDSYHVAEETSGRVEGSGLNVQSGGQTYAQTYAGEFSKALISRSAYSMEGGAAMTADSTRTVIGSRLRVVPFALLLSLEGIFAFTILFLGVNAIYTSRSTPFTHLARGRLANSLFLAYDLFIADNNPGTWAGDATLLFSEETGDDRLDIGPKYISDTRSGEATLAFGVFRRTPKTSLAVAPGMIHVV